MGRSRSSPHQRGNTPSGSEAPSWLRSPPSNRCGSASKNTTNLAHPSSTGNASKSITCLCRLDELGLRTIHSNSHRVFTLIVVDELCLSQELTMCVLLHEQTNVSHGDVVAMTTFCLF